MSHTGQIHQFSKFKEITAILGYHPQTVIVNVVLNDIENDFLHPQSTVIDGYQVDIAGYEWRESKPVRTEKNLEDLQHKVYKAVRQNSTRASLDPRNYSALATIISHSLKKVLSTGKRCGSTYCTFALDSKPNYPINHSLAKNNRIVINQWINDSKINGYRLIFSDINSQLLFEDESTSLTALSEKKAFCNFVIKQGVMLSFIEYLVDQKVFDWRQVRWKLDGHFNIFGNKLYAIILGSFQRLF